MIFYYGHPAALYVNKLRVAGLLSEPVNTEFEHIFETGVDEMAWDDLSKNDMMWPMVRTTSQCKLLGGCSSRPSARGATADMLQVAASRASSFSLFLCSR
jgi:hypothetical protein